MTQSSPIEPNPAENTDKKKKKKNKKKKSKEQSKNQQSEEHDTNKEETVAIIENDKDKAISDIKATNKNKSQSNNSRQQKVTGIIEVDEGLDISAWEEFGIHPMLLKGLRSMRFQTPTEIQKRVIPQALIWRDIIAAAETVCPTILCPSNNF